MGLGHNKLFLELASEPVLSRTLRALLALEAVERIVLLTKAQERPAIEALCDLLDFQGKELVLLEGGAERADSVRNGLRYLSEHPGAEAIMTHDAARPFLRPDLFERLLKALTDHPAAVPALPVAETTRRKLADGTTQVVEREGLYLTQTPQAFLAKSVESVFFGAAQDLTLTDEAGYFERAGLPVALVPGDPINLKLTRPEDLYLAEAFLPLMP